VEFVDLTGASNDSLKGRHPAAFIFRVLAGMAARR
jgi:hypothetical protein